MRPVRPVLLFLFLCALLLVFAAPVVASPAPATGGTLVYQIWNRPSGIDPVDVADYEGLKVTDTLFDSLTRWDAVTGEVLPSAALTWDVSADATVWTFHLDPAAKYSNGKPVAAADFKFAWERMIRRGKPFSYMLSEVKGFNRMVSGRSAHLSGVVASDATTLAVTLSTACADFKSLVGAPALGPVPRARFATRARAAAYAAKPVGNGPFKLAVAWNHLATVRLIATPGTTYTGVKPYIAGITFRTVPDATIAYERFKAGKLDVTNFDYDKLAEVTATYGQSVNGLTADPGHQAVLGPAAITNFIDLNTKKAPFDDVRIRQAASLVLDRPKLVSDTMQPLWGVPGLPATDILPPCDAGHVPGSWIYCALNVSQAQALLNDAGHPGGAGLEPVRLLYWPGQGSYAKEVKAELGAVGFTVTTLRVTGWDRIFSGRFQMWVQGWAADYPCAESFLNSLFNSAWNAAGCGYSGADAEIMAARATVDDAARLEAWKAVDAKIGADVPLIPIVNWGRTVVCSSRLHDATLSGLDCFDYTRVWISP